MREKSRKTAIEAILSSIMKKYKPNELPCLTEQYETWLQQRPLDGVKIFDATPLFHNTLSKFIPLLAGGAELTVGIHDRFNHDPEIAALLKKIGIPVAYNDFYGSDEDIVLDCAAIHSQKSPAYGFVELTRSGEHVFARSEKPCISVDRSVIKYFEDSLGTADGLMRALENLNIPVAGKKIVLFGYGKVGSGIAHRLIRENASLTVVEDLRQIVPVGAARWIDFRQKELLEIAASKADIIITSTGVPGIICKNYNSKIFTESSALLINMGAEDEFGECIKATRALNQKYPLNFMLSEPTRLRYLDATFALHNESALILLDNPTPEPGLHKTSDKIESRLIWQTLGKSIIREEAAAFLNRHQQKNMEAFKNVQPAD